MKRFKAFLSEYSGSKDSINNVPCVSLSFELRRDMLCIRNMLQSMNTYSKYCIKRDTGSNLIESNLPLNIKYLL